MSRTSSVASAARALSGIGMPAILLGNHRYSSKTLKYLINH